VIRITPRCDYEFDWLNPDDTAEHRRVKYNELVFGRFNGDTEPALWLVCWDWDKQAMRSFRADRIRWSTFREWDGKL
jgi:predicted DNA-binding transcriptional regulator YafY